MKADEAYARREFKRFLHAIGVDDVKDINVGELHALLQEMKKTAHERGMPEDEIDTIYDADALLNLYRETRMRSH